MFKLCVCENCYFITLFCACGNRYLTIDIGVKIAEIVNCHYANLDKPPKIKFGMHKMFVFISNTGGNIAV